MICRDKVQFNIQPHPTYLSTLKTCMSGEVVY